MKQKIKKAIETQNEDFDFCYNGMHFEVINSVLRVNGFNKTQIKILRVILMDMPIYWENDYVMLDGKVIS